MARAVATPAAGRVVFVGHTSVLSGAELCLLDIAPHVPNALVCLFEDGLLAAALRERGVAVATLGGAAALAGVRRDGGLLGALRAAPWVWRLARELARLTDPEDVIYANTQKSWIICALVAAQWRRTVVWHLHDVMSAAHFSRLLARTAVHLANRFASAVIANSKVTGETFVAAGGRRQLLRVVYNGIDVAPFAAVAPESRTEVRHELGLDPDALVVGVFGRIAPWKGQRVLLEALERLPQVHALIVGAPLFGETEYLQDLERRARYPGLAGRVHFLGFRSDVPAVMQAVDIVAHTSISPEPFGRVVVEGMLARRPVVATAAGGVFEIVDDAVNGLLVPPGDPAALARAIETLGTDAPLRTRLVAAGYDKAVRLFSLPRMPDAIDAVLAELRAVRSAARSRKGQRENPRAPIRRGLGATATGERRSLEADRVLLVSHSAEPSGAELSLIDVATWLGPDAAVCLFQEGPIVDMLRARGVRVEVLEGSRNMLALRQRARVLAVLLAVPAVLRLALELRKLAGPDAVLYANSQKAWIVSALVAWWDRKRVIWHLRDILSAQRFGRLHRFVAIFLANRVASRVLVNSAATGEAFVAQGGRRNLLQVVHNGIDDAPFMALRDVPRAALRSKLELHDSVTVGLFGRLAPWKGQHVLLEALERLGSVQALIVGDALFGEDDYRERLHEIAERPALRGRVRFLGYRADVPELMKAVDIVVHTSIEPEPFGRVIVEGMLAERPVIATLGGGVTEIVTNGVDGLLVAPNDAVALAAAIELLSTDRERARELAVAGRRNASERFLVSTMRRGVAGALDELVPTTQ